MRMSFHALNFQLQPHHTFILGDLTDEGKWVREAGEWEGYVGRADQLFGVLSSNVHVVIGNHDIGFHDFVDKKQLKRFLFVACFFDDYIFFLTYIYTSLYLYKYKLGAWQSKLKKCKLS